jgi:hypothetical protein
MFYDPDWEEDLLGWVENGCVLGLAGQLKNLIEGGTLADILATEFLEGCVECIHGTPACAEPYAAYVERLRNNFIPPDSQGAPILYVQGMGDIQATPERAACYLDAMAAHGVTPQVCVDRRAGHFNVVSLNLDMASAWIRAHLDGTEVPTCAHDATLLPACD